MATAPANEGEIPFNVPSIDFTCSTFYKVVGDLSCGRPAVVVLHGGPGGGHEYCLPFADLWPKYGMPVILYDQIGCGASTRLPQKSGDRSFWQEELFVAELKNLLAFFKLDDASGPGYHLIGQSWGGCLGSAFASTRPAGLQRLVLAGAVASLKLSIDSIDLLRQTLPSDILARLNDAERDGNFDSPDYSRAMEVFAKMYLCREDPFPDDLVTALTHLTEDNKTVYGTMYGPSTLTCNGTLADWTVIPRLPLIKAPTLVMNGEFDTSHDLCTAPFFEHIPHVRWITFADGGHMCHMEGGGLRERVLGVVGSFLAADFPGAAPSQR